MRTDTATIFSLNEPKTQTLTVRLTPRQKILIGEYARQKNQPVSQFLITLLKDYARNHTDIDIL